MTDLDVDSPCQVVPGAVRANRRRDLIAGSLLFAGMAVVYAALRSNHLTEDSLWYARDILRPGRLYFHPHHLLYNPAMRALLLPVGWLLEGPDEKLVCLQAWNILFGAAAIVVYWRLLRRLGTGPIVSLVSAAALGLCAFSCRYASQIEVYSLTGLFLCVSLMGLGRPDGSRARLLTAGGFAAAMLFHQTAIFFGAAILAHAILTLRGRAGRLASYLASTLIAPLGAVALVYAGVAIHLGRGEPLTFWRWITLHVQYGYWGRGSLSEGTLLPALGRLTSALVSTRAQAVAFAIALCLYVAACLAARGGENPRRRHMIIVCLVWMSILAAFTTWWDAPGAEFWGMFLIPAFLILTLVAGDPSAGRPGRALRGAALAVPAAALLVVLALSIATLHERNLLPNLDREAARAARRLAREGDRLWAAGTDALTYDRIYLADRQVQMVAINAEPARRAGETSSPDTFTRSLVDQLEADAREARSQGGRCLIDRRVLEGTISVTRLTRNLDIAEFRAELTRRFRITPLGRPPGVFLYAIEP